jgi:hypothetical protein
MSGEWKETVVEIVDKMVRRVGLDSWYGDATIILTFVAIVIAIAICSKISGLLGK